MRLDRSWYSAPPFLDLLALPLLLFSFFCAGCANSPELKVLREPADCEELQQGMTLLHSGSKCSRLVVSLLECLPHIFPEWERRHYQGGEKKKEKWEKKEGTGDDLVPKTELKKKKKKKRKRWNEDHPKRKNANALVDRPTWPTPAGHAQHAEPSSLALHRESCIAVGTTGTGTGLLGLLPTGSVCRAGWLFLLAGHRCISAEAGKKEVDPTGLQQAGRFGIYDQAPNLTTPSTHIAGYQETGPSPCKCAMIRTSLAKACFALFAARSGLFLSFFFLFHWTIAAI